MSNSVPVAYSNLPQVLARCQIKVSGLHEKLKAIGIHVNQKSLYRLIAPNPIKKIDTRILAGICQTCDVEIQDLIAFEKPKPVLEKLSHPEQTRLDDLMTRHNEGQLKSSELRELDELSEKAHQITVANARALLAQREALASTLRKGTRRPSGTDAKRTKRTK